MKYPILFFLCLALTACAANIDIRRPIPGNALGGGEQGGYASIDIRAEAQAPANGFIALLSRNLRQYLSELSLYPKKESPLSVSILIIGYEIKGGSSREVMGSLAGADEVKSRVRVIDTGTGEVVGESIVLTNSSMAYGQKGMAWVHADDIATFLSTPDQGP